MNLLQLTVFREVMLAGSVSQAARNLHRTQPAISNTIAQLETELGFCHPHAGASPALEPGAIVHCALA